MSRDKFKRLEISEYRISADVKASAVFLFVSDIHGCEDETVYQKIKGLEFDAALVVGDFVHDGKTADAGKRFLEFLSSFAPTFCSVGNHERKSGIDYKKIVQDAGCVLLDDETAEFRGIKLYGLSSGFCDGQAQGELKPTPAPDTQRLAEFSKADGYKIVLSHHPEYYDKFIRPLPIDLVLSGHAHGGQWRFFGRGVFSPGQGIFPKYTSGMYDGRLIVCRGLAVGSVPRIGNPPEISVIRLLPESR